MRRSLSSRIERLESQRSNSKYVVAMDYGRGVPPEYIAKAERLGYQVNIVELSIIESDGSRRLDRPTELPDLEMLNP